MKKQLPDTIISPQDLKAVIVEIRQYAKWYSQYSVKARVTKAEAPAPPAVSDAAGELIKEWADNEPSAKSMDKLIEGLQTLSSEAPRVTITLAAPAPGSLQRELTDWCRQNIDTGVLVSFRHNGNLLGGMVMHYGSKIFDWSFRRQILANSDKFPEVLRHV